MSTRTNMACRRAASTTGRSTSRQVSTPRSSPIWVSLRLTLQASPSAAMRSMVVTYEAAARSAASRWVTLSPRTSRVAIAPRWFSARTASTASSRVVPATKRRARLRTTGSPIARRAIQRRCESQRKKTRMTDAITGRLRSCVSPVAPAARPFHGLADQALARGRLRGLGVEVLVRRVAAGAQAIGSRGAGRVDVVAVDADRGRAGEGQQLRILGRVDGDHLDRRLEGVLGRHLHQALACGHVLRIAVPVQQLGTHRSGASAGGEEEDEAGDGGRGQPAGQP